MPENTPFDPSETAGRPADENNGGNLTTADLAGAGRMHEAPAEDRSFGDPASAHAGRDEQTPLFPANDAEALQRRWMEIQTGFVDEPRRAVEQADGLVADSIQKLAEMFAGERARLEGQWDRGDEVSTEEFRQALQRYRSFFTRLLSV